MPLDAARFRHEYDLDQLVAVRPREHDFEMLVTPRYRRHYQELVYEAHMSSLLAAMSRSHRLFLDVGAHYGFFSLLAGRANPGLEVLAFEPVPETHEVLERNLRRNGLPRATALRRAVSDRRERALFHISISSDNCSFHPHAVAPPIGQLEVETTTLDEVLSGREPCPTLVKIDTEGHELCVLRGMSETLARFPELALFVELNPKMQREAGHEPEELVAELGRLGFDVYLLDEALRRGYRLERPAAWREVMARPDSYANLYCPRRESSLSVCFVSHSAALGGAERSLLELASELVADHGAVCTVVLPEEGPLDERLHRAGAGTLVSRYSWWRVSTEAGGGADLGHGLRESLEPSARYLLGETRRELERIDPHVLVTHTLAIPWGAFLAAVLGKPHVWHVCEYPDLDHGYRFPVPFEEVAEIVRRSSNLVFTAVEGIRDRLLPEAPEGFFRTLYRHIEIPEPPSGPPAPLFTRPGAVHLGQFATHTPVKGQDIVLSAVARVVARGWDVELVLAGSGRDEFRRELSALIERLGLEGVARLEHFIPDVHEAIRQTDVVVVGSRTEAFGRLAVEAMLLAKPVVYPEVGGLLEYMRNGTTGLGYPPGDAAAMADAIEALLADPDLRARLGRNAREHALATFTRERYGGVAARALRDLRGAEAPIAPQWLGLLASIAAEARAEAELWRDRHDRLAEARQALAEQAADAEERLRAAEERLRATGVRVRALEERLRAAVARVRALEERLQAAGAQVRAVEEWARAGQAELKTVHGQLRRARRARDTIRNSFTWTVALRLRRPFDFLAPPGSRRRSLLRALTQLVTGGWAR